jgi:hypothetical protein
MASRFGPERGTLRPEVPMRRFLGLLVVVLAACGGQPPAPSLVATSTPGAVPTPTTTPTPKPTASPRTPAPAELQGRWRTVISDVDKPVLTITDFKYTIERLGIGTGSVEVHGDQIAFSGSNLCTGTGLYTWTIEGGTLTLQSVDPDPCANRSDAIRGRPFTRFE